MTQTLTKKIEEGLRQFPVLEVTVESDEAARRGVDPVRSRLILWWCSVCSCQLIVVLGAFAF
jgi:hypothetical protein